MQLRKAHELAEERDALRREVTQLQAGLERLQEQGALAHGRRMRISPLMGCKTCCLRRLFSILPA